MSEPHVRQLVFDGDPDAPSACCDGCYTSMVSGFFGPDHEATEMYDLDGMILCWACLAGLLDQRWPKDDSPIGAVGG